MQTGHRHRDAGTGALTVPGPRAAPGAPWPRSPDRCAPPPLLRPACKSASARPPATVAAPVMDGLRACRLLRNHSAARRALNLTSGVLKGGMSVFITYLSYNKYLKRTLTSSCCTIGLCGPGRRFN